MMIISNGTRKGSWHVGEEMNIPQGRVLTFTVDGDELEWLLRVFLDGSPRYELPTINYPTERLTPIL